MKPERIYRRRHDFDGYVQNVFLTVAAKLGKLSPFPSSSPMHFIEHLCRFRFAETDSWHPVPVAALLIAKSEIEAHFKSLAGSLSGIAQHVSPEDDDFLGGWRITICSSCEDLLQALKRQIVKPTEEHAYVYQTLGDPLQRLKNFHEVFITQTEDEEKFPLE